jgi:hypothetical protein
MRSWTRLLLVFVVLILVFFDLHARSNRRARFGYPRQARPVSGPKFNCNREAAGGVT